MSLRQLIHTQNASVTKLLVLRRLVMHHRIMIYLHVSSRPVEGNEYTSKYCLQCFDTVGQQGEHLTHKEVSDEMLV